MGLNDTKQQYNTRQVITKPSTSVTVVCCIMHIRK